VDSPDLKRLADEGFALEVLDGHLVVHGIPYVTPKATVRTGALVSQINFAGEIATPPESHVAYWIGEHPCHRDGRVMSEIGHPEIRRALSPNLTSDHTFSAKPLQYSTGKYPSYYEKVIEYVNRISGPAAFLDPAATARTFDVIESRDNDSVFRYTDSATARAGIGALAPRMAVSKVAIVGLGGTGAYVLDQIAKTPAREIHLFDPDDFLQSNAFRAPGAASLELLRRRPKKVDYLANIYDRMRRGIVAHPYAITESTVPELFEMHSVFLCVDRGTARRLITETLLERRIPCIDTGMGLYASDAGLGGQIAVTTVTPEYAHAARRLSFGDRDEDEDPYRKNIQLADLNALNAVLAVIRWKKLCGFYVAYDREHYSNFTVETGMLLNEELL
jgi:hypothetical protein